MSELAMKALDRARLDPAVFAEVLVKLPLWPHQLEVAASNARYRIICAGRRAGKTRVFGVLSLHQAFAKARSKVLIVSAGDVASKRMFADIAGMAASSSLSVSVADETKSLLTLSNGSQIECVPASMSQVRSAEADLLIVDEAGFVAQSIWDAAEPVIVARAGSRVLMCSTPWGTADHFFRVLWRLGTDAPDEQVQSFHWPSTVSPLVDQELLEQIRERTAPLKFAREYLAEFVDEAGAYFTMAELEAATGDYELVDPDVAPEAAAAVGAVVGGIDWGSGRRDANALTVVAALAEVDERGRVRYWLPWLEERFDLSYDGWIGRLVELASVFRFARLSSEQVGIGDMPTQVLSKDLWSAGSPNLVEGVWTSARLKENAFGFIHLLLQQGRLVLPRHPGLLKQLGALEYAVGESGSMRIAVPERAGHDDLVMSLALAVLPLMGNELVPAPSGVVDMGDVDPDLDGDMSYMRNVY